MVIHVNNVNKQEIFPQILPQPSPFENFLDPRLDSDRDT